jgi:hypothetical protein
MQFVGVDGRAAQGAGRRVRDETSPRAARGADDGRRRVRRA